jgi:hypothetical protein
MARTKQTAKKLTGGKAAFVKAIGYKGSKGGSAIMRGNPKATSILSRNSCCKLMVMS